MSRDEAITLLGCRPGASAREVRAAYRRAVREVRPDVGGVDGTWLTTAQGARDLLLRTAGPDRRRRERTAGTGVEVVSALRRRSRWLPAPQPRPEVDLRL